MTILNDAWIINLKSNQRNVMFSTENVKFVLKQSEERFGDILIQIDNFTRTFAKYGESLNKLLDEKDQLESVIKKTKKALEDDSN